MSRRGFGRLLAVNLLLGGAVVGVVGTGVMSGEDSEHASFYSAGSSIKGFLGDYCRALTEAFHEGSTAPLAPYYAEDFRAPERGDWVYGPPRREGGLRISELARRGSREIDAKARLAELADYLGGLDAVAETECKIHLIEQVEAESSATLTVRFVLGGRDRGGLEIEDRHFYRWHLTRNHGAAGEPPWLIGADELVGGTRTAGSGVFERLEPRAAGVAFVHRRDPRLDREAFADELLFDVIQHASGGLSVADFDGDQWPDVFLGDGVDSRLYRNLGADGSGRPSFADVTEETGLAGLSSVHAALFFDVDNDGDRDLFVHRYLAPAMIFINDGAGRFHDRSGAMGLDLTMPGSSVTALDYDRDGFLDLYLGATGNAFEAVPRLPFYATNGGANVLLRNDGGRRFVDVSAASGVGDTGWSLAVAAGDPNGDGWPDLGVANDFGRKSLYLNRGDGTFAESAQEAEVLDFSGGMGLAFGDYDNDGRLDLYTSNIYSNQRWYGEDQTIRHYLRNVLRTRWALLDLGEYMDLYGMVGERWRELGQMIGEGNSVFHNQGDGRFREIKDTPASFAGWSWGVAFLDWDNDADLDIYAANGWISATPETDL